MKTNYKNRPCYSLLSIGSYESILHFDINEKYDAIIFSRSLHHISSLTETLERCFNLLTDNGILILEEFDVKNVDLNTTSWYYNQLRNEFSDLPVDNPILKWEEDHHHDPPLNTGDQMISAVKKKFKIINEIRCPYLFRSIGARFSFDKSGYDRTEQLMDLELSLIEKGKLLPIGLRLIGVKV